LAENVAQAAMKSGRLSEALFIASILLALFHIPVLSFSHQQLGSGHGQSIGMFDLLLPIGLLHPYITKYRPSAGTLTAILLYLAFISTSAFSLVFFEYSQFGVLLLVKQVEYAVCFLVFGSIVRAIPRDRLMDCLGFAMLVFSCYCIYEQQTTAGQIRLGIPFKEGISSNPAGFILSAYILVLAVQYSRGRHHLLKVLIGIPACIALYLTFSRTNFIALVAGLLFSIHISPRNFKGILVILVLTLGLGGLYALNPMAQTTYGGNPLQYLNLNAILNDSSFNMRYTSAWFQRSDDWIQSPLKVLFGHGMGYVQIFDSLYFSLLFNTGIVGLVLYGGFLGYLFYRGKRATRGLLVFVMVNGINTETVLNSYRCVQVFAVFLVVAWVLDQSLEVSLERNKAESDKGLENIPKEIDFPPTNIGEMSRTDQPMPVDVLEGLNRRAT
jgi:hypothetical protein